MTTTAPPRTTSDRANAARTERRSGHEASLMLARGSALALAWLPFLVCVAFLLFWALTPITTEEEAEAVYSFRQQEV